MRHSFPFLLSFVEFDARSAPAGLVTRLPTVTAITGPDRPPLRVSHERDDRSVAAYRAPR